MKPYLIKAIYEWCNDNNFTPYVTIFIDNKTIVPFEYVNHSELILNISISATKNLNIKNDSISFSGRFSGISKDIFIPIENIKMIFAKETGKGVSFEVHDESPFENSKSFNEGTMNEKNIEHLNSKPNEIIDKEKTITGEKKEQKNSKKTLSKTKLTRIK
tara:strand:+ start:1954 stop:2433 length:480 start_codon:yes stop_codon:yes gene_type:complete